MQQNTRHWQWLGALGVAILLLTGCGSSDPETAEISDDEPANEEEQETDNTSSDAANSEDDAEDDGDGAPSSSGEGATEVERRDPQEPFSVGSSYDADAQPLLSQFSPFEPGTYRTGAVGTPLSFTATEALSTQPNGGGFFVVSDPSSQAPDDRELAFLRVGRFSDPTAPFTSIEQQAWWPNDDFSGWLDNLHDGVIATDPVETTVNGRDAISVDLELSDDIDCGFSAGACVGFVENNGQDFKSLNQGSSYRVWVVDQDDEDPLLIVSGIARVEDASWFARADEVLDTVAFGDVAPNPAQWLTPGPTRLNALGGVEVEIPDNVEELTNGRQRLVNRWTGRGFALIPMNEQPGAIYLSEHPHDSDGALLASTDDVVAELEAEGAELIELDATTIDGADTRVFDVTTSTVGTIMLRFSPLDLAEDSLGWDAPASGRIWLIEHPDRGPMMISTHAFENVEEVLPKVNDLGEAIISSMTFVS